MEFFNDVGADPLKPSLFELVAQEQLRDLLQPALKYVLAVSIWRQAGVHSLHIVQVFAQRYPRYLLRIVNRHEEFYAAIMLVVERHYLRKHSMSFTRSPSIHKTHMSQMLRSLRTSMGSKEEEDHLLRQSEQKQQLAESHQENGCGVGKYGGHYSFL